jgi:iron complex transport system permease protein
MVDTLRKPLPRLSPAPVASAVAWPRLGMRRAVLSGWLAALLGVFLRSLGLGSVSIPLGDILKILVGEEPQRATWTTIVRDFRLPRR